MKLEKLSDDNIIVFLNKFYIKKLDFSIDKNLDKSFKGLFKIMSNYYDIEIIGCYNIKIYQDNICGYIINIEREDIDFYNYYDDHIDMRINIIKGDKFIFKVDENSVIDSNVLKYVYIIKNNDNLYLIPKRTINQYELGNIIENTKIIYGNEANVVLDRGKYINTSKVFV